jgi:hydroxylaminobenzene mutase
MQLEAGSTTRGQLMDASRIPGPSADRALVAHAAIMTILGLVSGFTTVVAKAPRAALSAHTIGVLQGALLFGLAAIWPSLGSGRVVTAARWCALVGLYANWLGAQLAAFWSARAMFTVHGGTMPEGAAPWMEDVVFVLLNLSVLIIVMCLLILWAVWQSRSRGRAIVTP